MKVSVIVTHYKTPEVLDKCLMSLIVATKSTSSEVFVSDSETDQALLEPLIKKYAAFKFLAHRRNVGYGRLVNDCLKRATGEYILIINADMTVPELALQEWLAYMDNNPAVGVSGPKLVNLDGTLQYSCFRFYTLLTILARRTRFGRTAYGRRLLARFLMFDYERRVAKEVDWLMGSAILIRRAAYEKVGGMDPRFFMYFEDVDWCRRCWLAGYKVVFNPKIELTHHHMKASDTRGGVKDIFTNRLTRVHVASALKYFLKYLGQAMPVR